MVGSSAAAEAELVAKAGVAGSEEREAEVTQEVGSQEGQERTCCSSYGSAA